MPNEWVWPAAGGVLLLAIPCRRVGGEAEAPSRAGPVLGLALLVVAAKCGGLVAERWGQPSVLGELLVGIGAGNLLPRALRRTRDRLRARRPHPPRSGRDRGAGPPVRRRAGGRLARAGRGGPVRRAGRRHRCGYAVVLGWGTARWLLPDAPILAHLFVGATLTATSVGITARVLKDLGALQSREGQVILGAAVLDDILGSWCWRW